jgi:hypothetical protein
MKKECQVQFFSLDFEAKENYPNDYVILPIINPLLQAIQFRGGD